MGQNTQELVCGPAHSQPSLSFMGSPSWALTVRHLCGSSSYWLIRMSRNLFPLSSLQNNKVSDDKALVVLRVETQRIDIHVVVTMDGLVQKVADGHGKRKDFGSIESWAEILGLTT